jgi:hypothetical protein
MQLAYKQFMPNLYTTMKDLSDRLDSCLVRYKGKPYRCRIKTESDGSPVLFLYELVNKGVTPNVRCKPDDPFLDISILESMYVNFKYSSDEFDTPHRACWITRGTGKSYKSATFSGGSVVKTIDGHQSTEYNCDTIFWTQFMEDAILGKYMALPVVLSVMSNMKRQEYEAAVSQRVALKRESIGLIKVYIDTHIVGWIDPDTGKTKITNDDRRWAINRMLAPLGFKL